MQEDGWQIDGCPINGPAVAARGERVAVAWFTAAHDSPRVQVAFSNDGGESFDAAIAVAGSRALGRTDITLLPDDSALVTWLELTPRGEAIPVPPRAARRSRGASRNTKLGKLGTDQRIPSYRARWP